MNLLLRHTIVFAGDAGLATTNQSLQGQHVLVVGLIFLLALQELLHLLVFVTHHLVLAVGKELVETIDEVHEATNLLIAYGNVARSLIADVYVVALLHQTTDGSSHRDDIVVGMRSKDSHTLGIGKSSFGTLGVVGIGLSARPTGDGVLKSIKDKKVSKFCLSILVKQFAKVVLFIVERGEFEHGFAHALAEPDDGTFLHAVVPLGLLVVGPRVALFVLFFGSDELVGQMQIQFHSLIINR